MALTTHPHLASRLKEINYSDISFDHRKPSDSNDYLENVRWCKAAFYLSDCTVFISNEGARISNSYTVGCHKDDASCVETRWSSQTVSV